jgi:hypothetical protein
MINGLWQYFFMALITGRYFVLARRLHHAIASDNRRGVKIRVDLSSKNGKINRKIHKSKMKEERKC